jgi:hypothetical protein
VVVVAELLVSLMPDVLRFVDWNAAARLCNPPPSSTPHPRQRSPNEPSSRMRGKDQKQSSYCIREMFPCWHGMKYHKVCSLLSLASSCDLIRLYLKGGFDLRSFRACILSVCSQPFVFHPLSYVPCSTFPYYLALTSGDLHCSHKYLDTSS